MPLKKKSKMTGCFPSKKSKMLRKESENANEEEVPLNTTGDSAGVDHDKALADATLAALQGDSFDADHDKKLENATRAELKVRWEVIEKANKELKQAFQRYKKLVADEFARSLSVTPSTFLAAEKKLYEIDLSKDWAWHTETQINFKGEREGVLAGHGKKANPRKRSYDERLDDLSAEGKEPDYTLGISKTITDVETLTKVEAFVKLGIATRCAFIAGFNRDERETNKLSIFKANESIFRQGNILIDSMLFDLGIISPETHGAAFTHVYGIAPDKVKLKSNRAPTDIAICNMRATLTTCGSFSSKSLNPEGDETFKRLEGRAREIRKTVCGRHILEKAACEALSKHKEMKGIIQEMRGIVDGILELEETKRARVCK